MIQNTNDREKYLYEKYGISEEEYQRLLIRQNGVCGICHAEPTANRRLAVDHCHLTNAVRGLLCTRCNMGLGYFNDREWLLQKAVTYLRFGVIPAASTRTRRKRRIMKRLKHNPKKVGVV